MAEGTRAARGREAAGIAADWGAGRSGLGGGADWGAGRAKMAAGRQGERRGGPLAGNLRIWDPGVPCPGAGHPGRSGFSLELNEPPAWQFAVAAQWGALPVGLPAPLGCPEAVPLRAGGVDSPLLAARPHAVGHGVPVQA